LIYINYLLSRIGSLSPYSVTQATKNLNDRLNPNLGRRDLVRVLAAGVGVASAAPLAAAVPKSADADKKQRAPYQPNSPDVQAFYRVNRYPAK
jgi:hypothetical protein